jgi:hypothetical protein
MDSSLYLSVLPPFFRRISLIERRSGTKQFARSRIEVAVRCGHIRPVLGG